MEVIKISNSNFNYEPMIKQKMYEELDGSAVKVIVSKSEEITTVALYNPYTGKIYVIDEFKESEG